MMTRWKAFSYHITISASIAAGVSALILMLWYTPPFFSAVGGQKILIILLLIDVTLGPLITLIIFNPRKSRKELTFDLSIIAIIQALALVYGMSVIFQARPVYVVFIKDSFTLVTAVEISDTDLAKSQHPDFRSLPLAGPVYAFSEMPKNTNERNDLVSNLLQGKDLPCFPQYYKPYSENSYIVGQAAKSTGELKKLNPDHIAEINDAIKDSGKPEDELGFLPLQAKENELAVLVGKKDGKVLSILPLRPW